jgi:hypothetical protein
MNHTNHGINPYLEQALAEHHELHRSVEEIISLLDNTAAANANGALAERAIYRIDSLAEKLQQHFAQEEEGGYLEEAIARLPSLAPQAAVLQRQHAEFTRVAAGLLSDAKAATTPAACWAALQTGFKAFSKKLLAHEAAENSLLQRAYNVDLGLE